MTEQDETPKTISQILDQLEKVKSLPEHLRTRSKDSLDSFMKDDDKEIDK